MKNVLKLLVLTATLMSMGALGAQFQDRYSGFTNTTLPGYDNETNPNRTGIVSVTLHNNAATFYLDGIVVGKHYNYCHYDKNGQLHQQGFAYTNPSYTMYIEHVTVENVLDIYLDDVLIATQENWCEDGS